MLVEKYSDVGNQQSLSFGDDKEIQTKIEELTKKVKMLETQIYWHINGTDIHKQRREDYEDY